MYDGTFNVLGLMSGTSLDGMDAALVQFRNGEALSFEVLDFQVFEYPAGLKKLVKEAFDFPEKLPEADLKFAHWTTACVLKFKELVEHEIDLVAHHGQTIFHQPQQKLTVQIGCRREIARQVGITVVTNFRMQDVLLGGQGAPLVPFGDHVLYGQYEAALNLGGFANASIGNPRLKDGVARALDICPLNIVMNELATELGADYDKDGAWARAGKVNQWALDELDSLEFYDRKHEHSLGYEWVRESVLPLIDYLGPTDALATMVEHAVIQISEVLGNRQTLVSGGGAFNTFLIDRLRMENMNLEVPDAQTINSKEAVVFALLGHHRFFGLNNVLGETTGSGISHSSGCIYMP